MKKTVFAFLITVVIALGITSCGTTSNIMPADQTMKVAVVSFTVNNYAKALAWDLGGRLIWDQVDMMLSETEQRLASRWTVVPAVEFGAKPAFQALATDMLAVAVPTIEGQKMPFFGTGRKDLISANISAEIITELSRISGADYLVVLYSEWTVATGKWVPTSKALTRNVIQIYDSEGKTVYQNRIDKVGDKSLGAFGLVVVAEDTIGEWVNSFRKTLSELIP